MRRLFLILLASIAGLVAQAQYSGSEADSLLLEKGVKYFYTDKDYSKALEIFNRLAAKDIARAYNMLGNAYLHGYGVKKDYDKAYEYFKHSADMGYDNAMVNLGFAFYDSRFEDENGQSDGFDEDWALKKDIIPDKEARKWFTMAAKANGPNSARAYFGLATMCYYPGPEAEESWAYDVDGFPYLRKSAELGYVYSMIGMAFEDDPSQAISWLKKAKATGEDYARWFNSDDITIDEMINVFSYLNENEKWRICPNRDKMGSHYLIRHCGKNIVALLWDGNNNISNYYDDSQMAYAVFSSKGKLSYTVGAPNYIIKKDSSWNDDYIESPGYNEDRQAWIAETPQGDWVWLDLSGSKPRVIATEKK